MHLYSAFWGPQSALQLQKCSFHFTPKDHKDFIQNMKEWKMSLNKTIWLEEQEHYNKLT